jgi:tRNA A37 threonylcarbamoyladenosine dehydratase
VTWFAGKTIELWGCGALGSWIAEYLVRAGAAAIILRDHGYVTKGLLVRQNYIEADVGQRKVDALFHRLELLEGALAFHVHVWEDPVEPVWEPPVGPVEHHHR